MQLELPGGRLPVCLDGTPAPEENDTSTTAPELHPPSEEQATPQLGTPLSDILPDDHGL
ncbi:MAG: hypothetical protein AAFX99_34485 [Myxococcota bacterium]